MQQLPVNTRATNSLCRDIAMMIAGAVFGTAVSFAVGIGWEGYKASSARELEMLELCNEAAFALHEIKQHNPMEPGAVVLFTSASERVLTSSHFDGRNDRDARLLDAAQAYTGRVQWYQRSTSDHIVILNTLGHLKKMPPETAVKNFFALDEHTKVIAEQAIRLGEAAAERSPKCALAWQAYMEKLKSVTPFAHPTIH